MGATWLWKIPSRHTTFEHVWLLFYEKKKQEDKKRKERISAQRWGRGSGREISKSPIFRVGHREMACMLSQAYRASHPFRRKYSIYSNWFCCITAEKKVLVYFGVFVTRRSWLRFSIHFHDRPNGLDFQQIRSTRCSPH